MNKKSPARCYIDSSVIIDFVAFKNNCTIKDERCEEMDYVQKILSAASRNTIELFSSAVTILECHYIPSAVPPSDEVKRLFNSILSSGKVVRSISLNDHIASMARQMLWDGFPLPNNMDKIHIASAIFSKCSELITFDGFRRESHKQKQLDDDACIIELCKQHKLSVVYPSESIVAQREYIEEHARKKREAEIKAKESAIQKQLSLFPTD